MAGRRSEFDRIDRFLKPLAAGFEGALGLADDAGVLSLPPSQRLVVTTDAMVEGVHYLAGEPPERLARKLLRVNLSDVAAMGATPYCYTLTLALPSDIEDEWLEAFVGGLASDQETFDIRLLGGDSVSTPGPAVLSVTAFGRVDNGRMIPRSGARPGDVVLVSGTVGDGALGLQVARDGVPGLGTSHADFLAVRYHLPDPRIRLGRDLLGMATAGADLSDGLIGDLGHICRASGVSAVVDADRVPLSPAARATIALDAKWRRVALAGGDDYELIVTAPRDASAAVQAAADRCGVPMTPVGRILEAEGGTPEARMVDADGTVISGVEGWQHF